MAGARAGGGSWTLSLAGLALACGLLAGCGDEPLSAPVSISAVEGNGATPDLIGKPGVVIVKGSGFRNGDELQVRNPSDGTVNASGVVGSRYVSESELQLDVDPDAFEAGKRTLVVSRGGVPVAKATVTFLTGPEGPPGPPGNYAAGPGLKVTPGDPSQIDLKLDAAGSLSKTLGASGDELGIAPGGVTAEHLSSMGATTSGQVLKWNNDTGRWEPGVDAGTTYTAGTGIQLVGAGNSFTISADIGTGSDQVAAGDHVHSGADITTGTVAEARIDGALARDSEVMGIVLGADGPGSGLDADTLDGQHATAFAAATHAHSGADITSGTVADARLSSNVMLRDAAQTVSGSKTFTAPIYVNTGVDEDISIREFGIDRPSASDVTFDISNSGPGAMQLTVDGAKVWTAANDGPTSGLEADTLDGWHEYDFARLAGRAGGQALYGGTNGGDNLTLDSTSNATKGTVYVNASGGNVVLGGAGMVGVRKVPGEELDVNGNLRTSSTVAIATSNAATTYNVIGSNVTNHALASSSALLVSNNLEVDGRIYADEQLVVADRAAIGATAAGVHKLYVYRPGGDFGDGRSSVYGYRTGTNNAAEGGTGWAVASSDVAVRGDSYYGNNYTAGVAGYNYLDYPESAGVVGANYDASIRGALAYKDGSGRVWAGHFTGNVNVTGNVTASDPLAANHATTLGYENARRPGVDFSYTTNVMVSSSSTYQVVQSVTVSCPGSGCAIVSISCFLSITHNNGTASTYVIAIDDSNGTATGDHDQWHYVGLPYTAATGTYYLSASTTYVYAVTAGDRTFYFKARKDSTSSPDVSLVRPEIHAIFVPNLY